MFLAPGIDDDGADTLAQTHAKRETERDDQIRDNPKDRKGHKDNPDAGSDIAFSHCPHSEGPGTEQDTKERCLREKQSPIRCQPRACEHEREWRERNEERHLLIERVVVGAPDAVDAGNDPTEEGGSYQKGQDDPCF